MNRLNLWFMSYILYNVFVPTKIRQELKKIIARKINFDTKRWSMIKESFKLFFRLFSSILIVSKTLNSKWSIELLSSIARQLFFFKFSVSKWFFASGKRLIDIYYKFVAENSRVSDRIEEEQLPRVQKLRVQKLIGSEWWTRNMRRSTCFARLWKRIMGSLQIILILHVYNLVT